MLWVVTDNPRPGTHGTHCKCSHCRWIKGCLVGMVIVGIGQAVLLVTIVADWVWRWLAP
jgi:hypothetical protein